MRRTSMDVTFSRLISNHHKNYIKKFAAIFMDRVPLFQGYRVNTSKQFTFLTNISSTTIVDNEAS